MDEIETSAFASVVKPGRWRRGSYRVVHEAGVAKLSVVGDPSPVDPEVPAHVVVRSLLLDGSEVLLFIEAETARDLASRIQVAADEAEGVDDA